jgi:hypothetical protein
MALDTKTNISIIAKPVFIKAASNQPLNNDSTPPEGSKLMHMTSRIRGEQIADFIGAKLNPTEGYENDVCIYVKPDYKPGQTFLFEGKKSYLDILDGPHCIDLLKKYPEVTVIACSDLVYEVLSKTIPNKVVIIPEHHCNFERQRRNRNGITAVGCIGTEPSFKYMPKDIKELLAARGMEYVELDKIFTREDVVIFYLNIDVQIIWRPQFQTSYNQLRNPMKVINASSFGIPTIMYEEPSSKEMDGCFIPVRTLDEFFAELDKLRSNPELYDQYAKRGIEKSEKYHIENIAKLYRNLASE